MNLTAKLFLLLVVLIAGTAFPFTTHGMVPLWPVGTGATNDSSAASCLPKELDALLAFKQGITSDPTGQLASWKRGGGREDCCRWRGVRCSKRTGHVLELHLRNVHANNTFIIDDQFTALVGQISPSLLSLKHLEHLDLSVQQLQGPSGRLPEFLGSFKNLRYLNLSCIPFTGSLPPQLGNLSKLHYLDLSQSNTVYLPTNGTYYMNSKDISWLTRMSSLRYLNMQYVNLSMVGDWTRVANMIPSLRVLCLSQCSLQSANKLIPHINLTNLEELDLSTNNFDQPIASYWFWNITSIRYLNLADNNMYGQFPFYRIGSMTTAGMINLYNLEILDVRYNQLDGNITEMLPRFSSKKLKQLHLENNNITGVVPNWIGEFVNIELLDLSDNQLSGPLPPEIGGLSKLAFLDLTSNSLEGVVTQEHFVNLSSLESIYLSYNSLKIVVDPKWRPPFSLIEAGFASCQMGPFFPAWMKWQVDLSYLDISSAGITDKLPEWFGTTFANMYKMNISNNGINGRLPKNLEVMTSLRRFYLNSNQLTGPIPQLPISLQILDISNNSLSGPLPSNFGASYIDVLILSSNLLTGHIPASLCKLQNLQVLNLENNLFEGEFPRCSDPGNMRWILLLSNNSLSGTFPSVLKKCTNIYILDLSWNKFSGRLPVWIGELVNLEILQLGYNMFSQSIPTTITNLTRLVHLNLAGNSMSGVIPWNLSSLTGMTKANNPSSFTPGLLDMLVSTKGQELPYKDIASVEMVVIDLSSNFLTGAIPEEIASLDAIVSLNLSWNYLSGKIPSKIGAMQSLESLDLSRNKLYGGIPQSLSNLTYLSFLDLSYNNLAGPIPSGSQLDTLYLERPSMYDGNGALCGPLLPRNCSDNVAPKHDDIRKTGERYSDPVFFYFGLGVGFVAGLWVVFCVMLFKKAWRIAYFCLFDKAYNKAYVFFVVTWRLVQKRTIR